MWLPLTFIQFKERTTRKIFHGKIFKLGKGYYSVWASQVTLVVKNTSVNARDIRFGSLGRKDPLEEDRATHSSILAWRIPWTEEPGGLQSMGLWRVGHDWSDSACTHTVFLHIFFLSLWKGCCFCSWRITENMKITQEIDTAVNFLEWTFLANTLD